MSDSELKKIQHFRFWNKIFTTSQILIWKFYSASVFGLKKIQRFKFWIKSFSTSQILKICSGLKNHVFVHFTPWERHIFHFLSCFKKHDFELKNSLRVRFWIEKKTTRQILFEKKKYNASDFEIKIFRLVWFWNKEFRLFQILIINFFIFFNLKF